MTTATRTSTLNLTASTLYGIVSAMKRGLPRAGRAAADLSETVSIRTRDGVATIATYRSLQGQGRIVMRRNIVCNCTPGLDIAVPLAKLERALRDLKTNLKSRGDQQVTLDATSEGVNVNFGEMTAFVATDSDENVSAANYMLEVVESTPESTETLGTVTGHRLAETWNDVRRAATAWHRDGLIAILNCINVVAADGYLTMQATDRFRLALSSVQATGTPEIQALALPVNAVDVAHRLTGPTDTVTFQRHFLGAQGYTAIHGEHFDVYAQQLASDYPRLYPLLPTASTTATTFDVSDMTDALKLLKPHTDRSGQVKLTIGTGTVEIIAPTDTPQSRTVAATVDSHDGFDLTIGFNVDYLLDALTGHSGDVTMLSTEPSRPSLFVASTDPRLQPGNDDAVATFDRNEPGKAHLLMPVRL